MRSNKDSAGMLSFAGQFLALLDGLCGVREILWMSNLGFRAIVHGNADYENRCFGIGIFVTGGKADIQAEIRIGQTNFLVRTPKEIAEIPALASSEAFWKEFQTKAA